MNLSLIDSCGTHKNNVYGLSFEAALVSSTILYLLLKSKQTSIRENLLGIKLSARTSAGADDCRVSLLFITMIPIGYKITDFPLCL